jgi:tripartite-type tricarboxylate transporter receptor subunit TctC
VRITHVPYRGGAAALTDLVAGNIDAAFDSAPGVISQARAGTVRVLANCNAQRSVFLPDAPTMQEQGIADFSEYSWGGLFAPLNTPAPVIHRIASAVAEASRIPAVRERMERVFCDIIPNTPEQFARQIREEVARWEPVVRTAGITAQ